MGTNYYLKPKKFLFFESQEQIHIGKSSAGWCFGLHVYPEQNINDLDDWKPLFKKGNIYDEYGNKISYDKMIDVITKRKSDKDWTFKDFGGYYSSEEDFHQKNDSQRGPFGLLRCKIMDNHCIGHGEGTWDLIIGYFS